jgi:hypothetical protein
VVPGLQRLPIAIAGVGAVAPPGVRNFLDTGDLKSTPARGQWGCADSKFGKIEVRPKMCEDSDTVIEEDTTTVRLAGKCRIFRIDTVHIFHLWMREVEEDTRTMSDSVNPESHTSA